MSKLFQSKVFVKLKVQSIQKILIAVTLFVLIFLIILYIKNMPRDVSNVNGSEIQLSGEKTIAAWIWESPPKLAKDWLNIIEFSKEHQINTIYLYVDEYLDIYELPETQERKRRLDEFTNALRYEVMIANSRGISIHTLSGNTYWVDDEFSYLPVLIADFVLDFNKKYQDSKIGGMQFDIEFYNDTNFKRYKKRYTSNYLNLVNNLTERTNMQTEVDDLQLGFTIPFWFDDQDSILEEDILEMLFATLSKVPNSYIAVMAYRNKVEGKNGIIEVSEGELKLSELYPVKVIIGQEVLENDDKNITHFGKSKNEIKKELAKIIDFAGKYENFEGISIHDLHGFMSAGDY